MPYSLQRSYLANQNIDESIRNFVRKSNINLKKNIYETEFLSLDFETSGLDAKKDSIVSMGYVLIRKGRIVLSESAHHIIEQKEEISEESVIIHKITNEKIEKGKISLKEGLKVLLEAMQGRVVIAHHKRVEKTFLNEATTKIFNQILPIYFIDTMKIEMNRASNKYKQVETGGFRLYQLRKKYKLPQYHAHHSLEDAIATAELFLAQMSQFDQSIKRIQVGRFI